MIKRRQNMLSTAGDSSPRDFFGSTLEKRQNYPMWINLNVANVHKCSVFIVPIDIDRGKYDVVS